MTKKLKLEHDLAITITCIIGMFLVSIGGPRGHDLMVVRFTTTYALCVYHH